MRRALVAVVLLAAACGDDSGAPKGSLPVMPPRPAAGAASAALAAPGDAIDQGKEALLAEARERKFKNEDFVESETNRDPFRSFLSDFGTVNDKVTPQYEILLQKYSLDELKLAMIVGPGTETLKNRTVTARDASGHHVEPRAMFIDPTGLGVVIIRGNHISKADAKVVRIEPEMGKVFVEIKEELGGGKFRTIERVLELHQGEPTSEGNP